jgi:hypothetical protein
MLRLKNVDINRIAFSDFKIKYDDMPFRFVTPYVFCIRNKLSNKKNIISELLISLKYKNDDTFGNFIYDIDKKMIEIGKNNIDNWFDKNKKIRYKSLIRNNNGRDVVKIKLYQSKQIKTLIYDENGYILNSNLSKLNDICSSGGFYIKILCEMSSIWIKNDTYGINIKPHQLKILRNNDMIELYKKIDDKKDNMTSDSSESIYITEYILSEST